jgi:glycosyltransferase involved in cell wall biosynthesis
MEAYMLTESRTQKKWQEKRTSDLAGVLFNGQRVPRISVVIPTLNEEKNLAHVLPKIQQWVDEIVLVDGHSSDQTIDVARQLCPTVRVVMQDGRGKGAALRTGFAAATGDIIVMLDADGSTDPSEIPLYVGALLAGADFAKGSRFLQGGGTKDMPFYRKLGNWGFVWLVRLMFGGKYTDLCYGYNAFWKRVLPELDLNCDGFEVETMMNVRALKAGFKIIEVPSFEFPRVHGYGRLRTIPDGWRVLKTIFSEAMPRRQSMLFVPITGAKPLNDAALETDSLSDFDGQENDIP